MSLVALHRVHFDIGSGVQIEIESVLGRGQTHAVLFAAPGLVSADEEVDAKQFSSGGLPPMCWRAGGELFEPFQLREDTDYFVDVTVPLPIVETCQRAATHSAWPFNLRLASAFTREPVKRWREIEVGGRQHTIVTGQLRLRSHAGVLDLGTELGGSSGQKWFAASCSTSTNSSPFWMGSRRRRQNCYWLMTLQCLCHSGYLKSRPGMTLRYTFSCVT